MLFCWMMFPALSLTAWQCETWFHMQLAQYSVTLTKPKHDHTLFVSKTIFLFLLQVGKNVDKWLWMLSGARVMTRGEGDCNVVKSRNGSIQADFQTWKVKFLKRLQALAKGEKKSCSGNCKNGGSCKNKRKGVRVEAKEEEEGAQQNGNSEVNTARKQIHVTVLFTCVFFLYYRNRHTDCITPDLCPKLPSACLVVALN